MNNVVEKIERLWNGYKEFYVVGQPIYNIVTGEMKYIELLLRDSKVDNAKVALDKINITRKLNVDILLVMTADLIVNHFKEKGQNVIVNVNISNYVLGKEYILEELLCRVKDVCFNRKNIIIEVNEFADIYSREMDKAINKIKKYGFGVALDDIDSSIMIGKTLRERFKRFKGIKRILDSVDMIKVNSFNMDRNDIRSLCRKIKRRKKALVLENIETEEQAIEITNNNMQINVYLQGYFYSMPLRIEELLK